MKAPFPRSALWAVAAAMLVLLFLLAAVTVARFHIWAEIDERAHFAVVESIADQHRLPSIHDTVSPQVQAITDGTYPRPSPRAAKDAGLAGRAYEAFQPPLYYFAAAVPFKLVHNERSKVFVLRTFDLLLLAIAVVLLIALAREFYGDDPGAVPIAIAGAGLVLLWPGFVVRAITVSNAALEVPMVAAFMLVTWRAWRAPSVRAFVLSGLILGLCLLTKLTLVYLAAPYAIVLWSVLRTRRAAPEGPSPLRLLGAALAIPAAMVLAWVIYNAAAFGDLTQTGAEVRQQRPYLYPGGQPHFGLHKLWTGIDFLSQGVLPQEWQAQLDLTWVRATTLALLLAFVGAAVWAAVRVRDRRLWLVGSPALAALAMMVVVLFVGQFDMLIPRYVYAALPPLAMVVAVAAWRALPRRVGQGVFAAYVLTLGLLWAKGAAAYWFLNAGHSLGLA